ncbi:efflux RND transporter periplasmic adaptor subunit [uncultured Methylovirgula sp.]|uniref:efflux RND transporter periplasmic adaptor subunit n=1 Tax=uncultured Methylovirgula sp. TaxID=1285960 RepID=UPI00260D6E27|nr:efflux RND transporter periplasmic adaptor subunit [uncultured Methylovirgula sp.]
MSKPQPAEDFEIASQPAPTRAGTRSLGWIALIVLTAGLSYGAGRRISTDSIAEAATDARLSMVPSVRTVTAHRLAGGVPLDLPGSLESFETATIFARASGYISQRSADIGTQVKKGDVLAIIRSPELDQQVSQAEAALTQAKANFDLAHATAQRSGALVQRGWVTAQQFDQDRLTEAARAADVRAAQAALAAITQRRSYLTVVAPFAGVVTGRNIDVGDLVSADTTSRPMFSVARTDKVRVQVYVPQDMAEGLKNGVAASISVPEMPGRVFKAVVARTAHALDATSRTLLAEVDIDNPNNVLTIGTYVRVHFNLVSPTPHVRLDANALIYDADGLRVAVVKNDHAQFVPVRIVRDFGAEVEIGQGLRGGESVILNPPAVLKDGGAVHVAAN